MMKKVLAIGLLVFYLGISLVDAVQMHFCHDNLISLALNTPAESCCEKEKAPCPHCKDILIEIEYDSFYFSANSKLHLQVLELIPIQDQFTIEREELNDSPSFPSLSAGDSPPREKFFIAHCSFMFYG